MTQSNYTKHIQALDSAHHLHPFMVHADLRAKGPRVITRAEGVYLWDSEGARIVDGMAGLWCVQLGYGVKELADVAYEAMRTLPYYNTFFQTTTPYAAELSSLIAEKTPEGLNDIFFACSGSEANDTAIKIIWYYWNLMGRPEKKAILSRKFSYHGSTVAGASMTGLPFMQGIFDLPLPRFHHVEPPPYSYGFAEPGESDHDFAMRCARAVEEKILELGPENVAAFVGEPVMGAGGLMVPPEGYWPEVERICRKYDVLLWSDEVICGFGRLGHWFGCQAYGVNPEIITMAKGVTSGYQPLSAVALNHRVSDVIVNAKSEMAHGYTYSGHPVACAVALRNIQMIEEMDLVGERGRAAIDYFQSQLMSLADHPLVGEARGKGLLGAIELVKDKKTKARFEPMGRAGMTCRTHCFREGVIMRAVRDSMFLCPPLVISNDEIDEMFALVRRCLDLTARELAGS